MDRRSFIKYFALSFGSLILTKEAFADTPLLDVNTTSAITLGYIADPSKVNKEKYPQFASGQNCATCAFYKSIGSGSVGNCSFFPGVAVASGAWCSVWQKKT